MVNLGHESDLGWSHWVLWKKQLQVEWSSIKRRLQIREEKALWTTSTLPLIGKEKRRLSYLLPIHYDHIVWWHSNTCILHCPHVEQLWCCDDTGSCPPSDTMSPVQSTGEFVHTSIANRPFRVSANLRNLFAHPSHSRSPKTAFLLRSCSTVYFYQHRVRDLL